MPLVYDSRGRLPARQACAFHPACSLVFVTKYRRRVRNGEHIRHLAEVFRRLCNDFGATPGRDHMGPAKMSDRTMSAAQRDTLAPWVLRVRMMMGVRGATRAPGRPDTRRGTSRRTQRSPGTPAPMIPPPTSNLLATGARLATRASRHPGRPARPGQPPVPAGQSRHSASPSRAAHRRQGTCLAAARRRPEPRCPEPPGHPGGRPPAGHYPPGAPAPPGPCRPAGWPRPAPPCHPGGRPPRLGPRVAAPRRGGRFPRRNAPRPG
jgi:hypothetical protein